MRSPSTADCEDVVTSHRLPLLAASRVMGRWTRLLHDVQDLTLEGSIEPRKWIGCAERFWIGMADDAGDWLRVLAGDAADSQCRLAVQVPAVLPQGHRALEVTIEVPPAAFELLEQGVLMLRVSQLQCGDDMVVMPKRHMRFSPVEVSAADRFSELHLFDLPTFHAGAELRGVVWVEPPPGVARGARGAIAVAELRILVS